MKFLSKGYIAAILWAIIILTLCTIHLGSITKSPLFFAGFDKLVHCGMFFVLVVLMGYGYFTNNSKVGNIFGMLILVTIIAIIFGGIIELLQYYFIPWRSGEWDDLFADTVGALMGSFSILIIFKALNYVKK